MCPAANSSCPTGKSPCKKYISQQLNQQNKPSQCHRIQQTMGHINKLVNAAMPEEEEDESEKEKEQRLKRKSTCLMSNVNANIMSLNGLLQQLNQLLEQQNDEQASLSSIQGVSSSI